jgi:hypothetical protein
VSQSERIIAIDWSGAAKSHAQKKHIWTADICRNQIRLCNKRTRDELFRWLVENISGRSYPAVIGIDFAFSFPESFFRQKYLSSVGELWNCANENGEQWLRACEPPFWGRPGKKCPSGHKQDGFRQTDRAISVNRISPKSPFQIGGAGAVGTGSIRGMPILARLRQEGFSIWPFDPAHFPLVVEIYPRLLTGEVNKSQQPERATYLRRPEFACLAPEVRRAAESSEDAFDALVSALKMRDHAHLFALLQQSENPIELLEGRIWSLPQAV